MWIYKQRSDRTPTQFNMVIAFRISIVNIYIHFLAGTFFAEQFS